MSYILKFIRDESSMFYFAIKSILLRQILYSHVKPYLGLLFDVFPTESFFAC